MTIDDAQEVAELCALAGCPERTAAYLAVLRTFFRRATLVIGPTTVTVTLEFVPAN